MQIEECIEIVGPAQELHRALRLRTKEEEHSLPAAEGLEHLDKLRSTNLVVVRRRDLASGEPVPRRATVKNRA